MRWKVLLTNNHDVEVEALANALAVPLVRQVGEANIASELPTDNISGIIWWRCCDHHVRTASHIRMSEECVTYSQALEEVARAGREHRLKLQKRCVSADLGLQCRN
jgi:hypothetical protein